MTPEELTARGYRRVSNKYGIVARIDRPDWREFMLEQNPRWQPVPASLIADYYRRCVSTDTLTVGPAVARHVPSSNHDATGYVPSVDAAVLERTRENLELLADALTLPSERGERDA